MGLLLLFLKQILELVIFNSFLKEKNYKQKIGLK